MRVVLLGNSWAERSSVGNLILGITAFNTEKQADCCIRVGGQVNDKKINLINTPDLLHPDISEDKLTQFNEECMEVSDPGPHVFLLVLQAEDFTTQHKQRLERILESFSERSYHHSLLIISTRRKKSSGIVEKYKEHPLVGDMIRKCKHMLWQKNLERPELLMIMDQIVKENDWNHLSSDVYEDAKSELPSSHGSLKHSEAGSGNWGLVRDVGRLRNQFY